MAMAEKQIEIDGNDSDMEQVEDEEFKCCVCLELMYKPVVLACGHICCFWCVYRTMNVMQESNCPICRHPYAHFPYVCRLLHFVLQKLYPLAYKKRELQVAEEEKNSGQSSPQFTEHLHAYPLTALSNTQSNSFYSDKPSSKAEDPSCSADLSKKFIPDKSSCSEVASEVQKASDASSSKVFKECALTDDSCLHKTQNYFSSSDFSCPACRNLLFRPVVLNCGHVHCESCLAKQQNDILMCQVCDSPNPIGLPKVCLVLEHLIADQFQEQYAQRREFNLKHAEHVNGSSSNGPAQRTIRSEDYLWGTGKGLKIHILVGCDSCGMSPIIGERYKCKDCTEKIGFDLCETCYARSSNLPGRFNQQHRPDHQFEIEEPVIITDVHLVQSLDVPDDGLSARASANTVLHDAPNDLSNVAHPDHAPPST